MRILIPSARTTEQGHSKFVVYTLLVVDNQGASNYRLSTTSPRFKLERRYRDFHALYKNLRRLHPSLEFADFPPKKIRHLNDKVTQERRVALQAWLQTAVDVLLAMDELLPTCVQEFLDLDKNNIPGLLIEDDYSGEGLAGIRSVGSNSVAEHQPILCFMDEPFKEQDSPTLPNIVVDATLDAIY